MSELALGNEVLFSDFKLLQNLIENLSPGDQISKLNDIFEATKLNIG